MQSLIEKFRAKIEEQEWCGKFGGLVRTVERVVPMLDGSKSIRQAFPVSCAVTARNCFETGEYLALTPNDEQKSVCYFEQLSDSRMEDSPLGVNRFSTDYRFVCWLNLPKLGISNNCRSTSEKITMEVVELLECSYLSVSNGVSGLLSVKAVQLGSQNNRVFEKYSYDDKQVLLMPPYDFFSIIFQFDFDTEGLCRSRFSTLPEIVC